MFVLGALGAGFIAGRVLRAVDTSTIKDAVRAGATGDEASGGGDELVSGAGTLGALQAGMPGTTPADLVDPPTEAIPTARPPRVEPLRADGS